MSLQESNVVSLRPEQDHFEEFWKLYPRKVGKPLARAKWNAITGNGLKTRTLDKDSGTYVEIELHASPAEIIAGAKAYREQQFVGFKLKDDGKFIAHPATWLNQGRWEDGVQS